MVNVIWHKKLSKGENLACILKSAWIPLAAVLLSAFILSVTKTVPWGVLWFFLIISAVTLLITVITALAQKPAEYTATTAGIICKYHGALWQARYEEIESAKFTRYIFNRSKGKIKFKMKRGFSISYRFYMVDNVEIIYNLILMAMNKRRATPTPEKTNTM
ncbi:MAG: hypothetical protein K2N30_02460 [Clostridia bacterium]|nr:hypothetical protein [Clostridia bacterium]